MVSKNNQYWKQQRDAQRVPHYGLRKLSVGVASVLLSTTLYMGATAHADTINSQNYEMLDSKVANNSNSSNGDSVVDRGTNSANATNTVSGDSHVDASVAEATAKNEVNTNPQITEINNGSHAQSDAANVNADVKSNVNTPSNEMFSAVATETSSVPMSPSSSSSSQGAVTAPVESEASNETNSQTQPSSTTDTTQTKLSHRPVMRLAAATATNSDELIVGKDVTISDFSVTTAEGKNEFENAHANIKFTMHADDPSALAGKRLTIQLSKMWNGFYSSIKQDSNPATISYQGQVIGTFHYGYPYNFVYITFNDHVKNYAKIDVQSDLVIAGSSQRDILYVTSLYTSTKAKDGQIYHLADDVTIGQQKYSSNLPSVIHYRSLASQAISSVTDVTTTSYAQKDSELYAGTFYKTPNGIYYSQSSYSSGISNLYAKEQGQPGYLYSPDLYVGTDVVTDHTQSYTATIDIDQTKLSLDRDLTLTPITSYSLAKNYWDDKYLLPNTSDVYFNPSQVSSSTTTADATVTKNGIIFNKLNGQSLSTQRLYIDSPTYHMSWTDYTNYISQANKLYLTPALFKQLQAVAESDQNLTEAVNTVKTTGWAAKIKLANPIDTGLKATIKTSDGKTKEVSLLIDTIDYSITTVSTAPKGAILVAAQGKTVKVYHHGDQNIPAVVDQNKLTKTITRTINVHEPGKKVTTIKQAVVMTQSVSVIDGKDVTYNGDWKVQGNSSWARYDAPVVPGYTVNYPHVASQSVSDATEDQTIEITYAANAQTTHVNYVDAQGKLIHMTTVNGKTGQTVKVSSEIPDGWKLVDGQTVPNEITFDPDGHADMSVKIEHQHVTVTPDMPKTPSDKLPDNPSKSYPSGVAKDDLSKTVTRKVTITTPDGKQTVTNQTVTFTRNATVDEVTGEVTYGSWSENGKHEFATVDVPNVPGYTATGDVPSLTVTPNSKDTDVTINYTANEQSTQIVFVDDDNEGKTVDHKAIHGKTDETVNLNLTVPDKYQLADGQQLPTTYTFANGSGDVTIHLVHKVVQREATVDVQIGLTTIVYGNYKNDDDGTFSFAVTQTHWKQLDNEIKDSKNPNSDKVFPLVKVGTLTGHVNYDLVDNQVMSFKDDWTTLNLGGQTYQMPDGTDVVNGVLTSSLWGKSLREELLKYNPNTDSDYVNRAWHGYLSANKTNEIVESDFISDDLQVGLAGNEPNALAKAIGDQAVTAVTMANKTIDPNWLKRNSDEFEFSERDGQLQGDAFVPVVGVYIPYVEKTATRTINITTPNGKTTSVKQTATLAKQIDFGEDAHPDWTTGEWSNYDVPTIPGYTASQDKVNAVAVYGDTTDQTVNISYTANKQSVNINYIDINDGNKVVHTTTVNGVTDGDTNVPNELPAGYKLVDGQSVPKTVHFNANNNDDINVKVQHTMVTVTPDSPKTPSDKLPNNPGKNYPSGVAKDDLTKTVTRKVTITTPDNKSTVTNQTVTFTRNAIVDEITGNVTYGFWSENGKHTFVTVDVPTVPGYTANSNVPSLTVTPDSKDTTVTISYTANKQQININYVDVNDGNKVVHTTIVNGVTDGDSVVPNELPAGYKLVDSQSIPKAIHFNADNNDDINIKVQHATVTVTPDSPKTSSDKLPDNPNKTYPSGVSENDLNKMVTRTIKVTTPNGQSKTVAQTVKLTRTATVDEVTGEVTYGKWLTGQWGAYDVPSLNGYTATQTEISATPVDENTKNQTVDVSYTPNKQSTIIKYVDNKGEVVHTTAVNGVTDQTVKVSSEVPAGWTIIKGQVPSEITFGADGHEPIEVTVAHQHVTVVPDNPQNNGTKLPDNPAKTFNGVEANDLNKTITRTIKVTTPDGQTKMVEQGVHLTRTADVDEVTGEVTYGNWTTGEWSNYDVPALSGYTPSQSEVPTAKVTGDTQDQTVTVTYTADQQNLIVNFIDDTTGQTLKTVNKDGLTNSNSNYNTKSDIQNYVNNHYRLVSDDTNGQNLVFDNDDSKAQTYNVHLAHNTHNINDSNTVTETIHYKLDNGQKAFDDYNAQLSFTRTGYNDEVTGQNHWNDWQATNGQTFNAVQSPSKEGYTPDKTSIEAINVNPGNKNIDTTVTYNANAQTAKISYIDDITGRTLKVDNANGKFNQAINFDNNVDNQIKDYEQQGYALKSNNFSNQTYQADNAKNVFEVHLIHGTKNVQRTQKITETVQYQMEDGTKAPVTNSQSTSFTQDGVQDLVTNNIDWKATAPQQFKTVDTPTVTGYTPDITSIPVITVNFGDKDISKIVTYKANAQTAKISYIDDNTGVTLKTDNTNGKFNQAISFDDVDGAIKGFEDKGYQLKSNSFKDQKYQADNNSNVFEVHLVHGTKNVQRTQKITETINYQMDDGSEAPATNTQSVDFTQDGVQDLVTNDIDWKATEPQQFKAVDIPTVTGYTPNITNVPATTVNFGDKDINKLVTYKANAQNATINYIDDTTGKTIKTDNANGKFNQPISFDNNVDNQIKAFEDKGYQLKSNSFKDQKYQADNNSNVFEVHLVHGTKNVQRTQKITETVNYQMDDGSQAPSINTQSVNFTQNGVQDLVTNNIDWKATDPQQFKAVDSPTLTGYTPDIVSVPVTTVNFGDKDINKTVTYKANPQSAKITYIDDNTGKTLKVDDANGKFNQVIDFANMNSDIKDFESQGYVLKSNSFNGQKYQANNAKNTFEVHFTHGTKNVQRQDTITETVKYQYDNGTPAHENNVQTLNLTQDGVQDLVTKNIEWKPTNAQEFKPVDTPAIDGYTPDIVSISATKVNFGDSDINKVVTYKANNQTANIHYVDDMTGSSIGNSTANGKFGTVIDFGNVNDKINTFKSLGYQLVSNEFNGQAYQSDNSKNVYYVHFTHGIKNVQRNKQITETIKYQYENGQQTQPDSVQTVSFNENGSQDLVTKKINWFNDAPQQFKAVNTPAITGYTADIDNIPAVVVSYDNDNINKVVTYKANSQAAKINYIDDTTGKVIKTDTANGKFNQAISFSETPTDVVNDLIKRGYKLVSNSFNGQTYQNDNSKNEFTVHLAHNTKNVSKQNTVTRTINYLDNDGKSIQTPTVETVTFTQNGITDLVTGNTTWNTPSSQTFETVTSPTIKGFGKPDVEVVKPQTVNFNDQNVVVNVHYPKATTPTNVDNNTTTPTVDHDKGKLNPTTFTTITHQTTPQAHTANNGSQQSITPQSVNKPSEQQTVANNGTNANTLPQTGNSNDNSTAIVGLGLLSGMLGLLGIKGKKKQN